MILPPPLDGVPEPTSYEPGIQFQVEFTPSAGPITNGTLIAHDGEAPFVGRVVASELNANGNYWVTLEIPTVPEVFNDLQINEEFKLQNPNIEFDEALDDYFETTINADGSITLLPKVEGASALAIQQKNAEMVENNQFKSSSLV